MDAKVSVRDAVELLTGPSVPDESSDGGLARRGAHPRRAASGGPP